MKLLNYIRTLFKRPYKEVLPPNTKIRLMCLEGVNIGAIPSTGLYYFKIHQYVTITRDSTLIYLYEKNGLIYFRVRRAFIERENEAPDGAIIYFTKHRFKNNLIYRVI